MANTKDGITVKKIVVGYVIQTFRMLPEQHGGTITCESQKFTAGDDVTWEDEYGAEIEAISEYQSFDMVQPSLDYYLLTMIGCVDPYLTGPFDTEKEADDRREEIAKIHQDDAHTVFSVTKGAKIEF